MADALIIGPGAIGIALSAQLAGVGLCSVFLGRGDGLDDSGEASPRPVRLDDLGGSVILSLPRASARSLASVRVVLVTVKAYDLDAALFGTLRQVAAQLSEGVVVIPVANGAVTAIVQEARSQLSQFVWRQGFCTFGVTQINAAHYAMRSASGCMHWGLLQAGGIRLRTDQQAMQTIEQVLQRAPRCRFESAIEPLLQRKWLFNTVLNTLTAARGYQRNGAALNDLAELASVFDDAYQLGAEHFGTWRESAAALYNDLLGLIHDTAENENSMARDVRLGLKTEGEYLAGLTRLPQYAGRFSQLAALDRQVCSLQSQESTTFKHQLVKSSE